MIKIAHKNTGDFKHRKIESNDAMKSMLTSTQV